MTGEIPVRIRRVLMTVDAVGGVWRYALDAAAGLRERGIETVFAGFGPPPSDAQRAEARSAGELHWLDGALDWMAEREDELDGVSGALDALAHRTGAELLHLNQPSQAAGGASMRPVVAVSHSCVSTWFRAVRGTEPPPNWGWQERRNRDGFARATVAVAPSRSHAALLAECYGALPPVRVVPNAVLPLEPAPASDGVGREEIVFAAARWWDEGKNGAALDRAAPAIRWPVLAAGALVGPNGQRFGFATAEAPGPLPAPAVRAWMARAGIFVSPSRYEPFGLAALEAASGGCALVLADIPTYRELWHGAALFAPPDDPAALAAAVNRLVAEPALRRDLAGRARARADGFTRTRQTDALLECYAKAA